MNILENKDPLIKEIAMFLSQERGKKGLTMQDISNRIGKSTAYISNILNAKISVKISTYRDFAEVGLGIPPTTFDAKVQEITRRLVGAEPNDLDLASFLARDGLDEESIRKVQSFIDFVKMQK